MDFPVFLGPHRNADCRAGREIFKILLIAVNYEITSELVRLIWIILRNGKMSMQNGILFYNSIYTPGPAASFPPPRRTAGCNVLIPLRAVLSIAWREKA